MLRCCHHHFPALPGRQVVWALNISHDLPSNAQRHLGTKRKDFSYFQYSVLRRNGQIPRKVKSPMTEPRRDRRYEQRNCWYWNWICNLKTPNKQKSRARWLHRWMLPNILRRVNTCPFETTPKHCRGRNTSELILCGQHHPDTKTRQWYHRKRKS